MQIAIHHYLKQDSILNAFATGGIWATPDFDRTRTPQIFDSKATLKPFIYVGHVSSAVNNHRPHLTSELVDIYFYDHAYYDTIKQMRKRVYDLLNGLRLKPIDSTDCAYKISWTGDICHKEDNIADCQTKFEKSSFQVYVQRNPYCHNPVAGLNEPVEHVVCVPEALQID